MIRSHFAKFNHLDLALVRERSVQSLSMSSLGYSVPELIIEKVINKHRGENSGVNPNIVELSSDSECSGPELVAEEMIHGKTTEKSGLNPNSLSDSGYSGPELMCSIFDANKYGLIQSKSGPELIIEKVINRQSGVIPNTVESMANSEYSGPEEVTTQHANW